MECQCNNDLNNMIDIQVGEIADLVLLMVDGFFLVLKLYVSFIPSKPLFKIIQEFQETFEFLNILQSHCFPKFIGIFSHLDG